MDKLGKRYSLIDKTIIITGGAGLLGVKHAEAVMELGASVALLDIDAKALALAKEHLLAKKFNGKVLTIECDITSKDSLLAAKQKIITELNKINVLINNAANNPKIEKKQTSHLTRVEDFSISNWQKDIDVGLTGTFLCCQVFGSHMAKQNSGIILNIASDLSVMAPDQRIYHNADLAPDQQPVKPISYSVVKTALIGLTRYLATYWATNQVRVNALSPGGIFQDQPEDFVKRLTNLIPMQRMALVDEYHGAIQFLCSDASSYMTGQNIVIDGGRSVW